MCGKRYLVSQFDSAVILGIDSNNPNASGSPRVFFPGVKREAGALLTEQSRCCPRNGKRVKVCNTPLCNRMGRRRPGNHLTRKPGDRPEAISRYCGGRYSALVLLCPRPLSFPSAYLLTHMLSRGCARRENNAKTLSAFGPTVRFNLCCLTLRLGTAYTRQWAPGCEHGASLLRDGQDL